MTADISEKGLETIIMRHMTGEDGLLVLPEVAAAKMPPFGGTGYVAGSPKSFDRAHAIDVSQLFAFLHATQPEGFKKTGYGGLKRSEGHQPPQVYRAFIIRAWKQARRH